jgi:hypothetical protein
LRLGSITFRKFGSMAYLIVLWRTNERQRERERETEREREREREERERERDRKREREREVLCACYLPKPVQCSRNTTSL